MGTILRPEKGIAVRIGGIEFHFLFTFAVIDDLQTFFDAPLSEIINKLTDNMTVYAAAGRIVEALIRSDIYNNGGRDFPAPTYEDIMHVLDKDSGAKIVETILRSYGIQMPEAEDDDDEDGSDPEQINIARLLVIGKTELGMSEDEFWQTTPRKYFRLFEEYVALKGGAKKEEGIDALP